jgi:hypothetical protein
MERHGGRGMELNFDVVVRSMDGGRFAIKTFKMVSEDESVSFMWGMAIYRKVTAAIFIHFENTQVTTTYWKER